MNARRVAVALILCVLTTLGVAGTALAHPLGNYTVNRAVAVTLMPQAIAVRYLVDMAEIPAFATLQAIDLDADGMTEPTEARAWAEATCNAARVAVALTVDGRHLALAVAGYPELTFPDGAGGLETLRLECPFRAAWDLAAGEHLLAITDRTDDGHVGWREVTVVADGGSVLSSDVPAVSPSAQLTAYPTDSLATPPDVRSGIATFRVEDRPAAAPALNPQADRPRSTSDDPFASLIAGQLSLPVALLAIILAAALGAVHALSPGHGKTLVAAYLIGSRGTLRQATGLGLTVAVTHTFGVFALGSITLVAGEFFVPERVIAWLSVVSGGLVALMGIVLVWRALRSATLRADHDHVQGHDGDHGHEHPHPHPGTPSGAPTSTVSVRGLLALGLAGGMVPSASALIVLLAAVNTGRLIFGIGLIVAFGVGMAAVLAGLAAATTLARRAVVGTGGIRSWPLARRLTELLPVASGIAVLAIGGVVTIAAIGRIG
jgi:ABC-type nickel/cobalt efflux system permease component RcnA